MTNNKKALLLASLIFTSLIGGSLIGINAYNKSEINSFIDSELNFDNSNLAFNDMFNTDKNEINMSMADYAYDNVIASGSDLVKYLIDNDIYLLYISGVWYSKDIITINVPNSILNNNIYYMTKTQYQSLKPKDDSDYSYDIITTSYDELSKYDVKKLLRFNKTYLDDKKYAESYFVSQKKKKTTK